MAAIANFAGLATLIPRQRPGQLLAQPQYRVPAVRHPVCAPGLLAARQYRQGRRGRTADVRPDGHAARQLCSRSRPPNCWAWCCRWSACWRCAQSASSSYACCWASCSSTRRRCPLPLASPPCSVTRARRFLSLESTAALDCTEEQRQRALDYVMPKMIVGGFVTVTIASVAFAESLRRSSLPKSREYFL